MQVGYGMIVKNTETGDYMSGLFDNKTHMISSFVAIPTKGMPHDFANELSKINHQHILFFRGEFIEKSFFIKRFMNFHIFPKKEGIFEFIKKGKDLDRLFPDLYNVALLDHTNTSKVLH